MRELNITWNPTPKQLEAWRILNDKTTYEILYGGSAGSGKSVCGCAWLILSCLKYPGTRWLMGRAALKDLKDSTLLTFFELCSTWGLVKGVDYNYNALDNIITFLENKSTIYLKDLFQYPSDPEFAGLGSREYTGVFIDEAAQITEKAYDICKSRIRYKLDKYRIIPKMLICSNPCKNFLYFKFYKPWKAGELPKTKKFIPALSKDNKYISDFYIENLNNLDRLSKERLLFGNWEYDENLARLIEYDKILGMFTNQLPGGSGEQYLTADIARFGDDLIVIMYWVDFQVKQVWTYRKQGLDETRKVITKIMEYYKIPKDHVIADEDGLGSGIVDELKIQGFINNSRALELKQSPTLFTTPATKHNYANLKSQCYYILADMINNSELSIYPGFDQSAKIQLIEELEQITRKDPDKDGKLAVVPKDEMKKILGRSTNYSDTLMMRMWFTLKPRYKPYIAGLVR